MVSFPILVSVNYNAGAFVTLVWGCLLLNAGGAVYLLARANLEWWRKILFAAVALASPPEDCQGSSYNHFALDKATVTACPIEIDGVRLPLGHRA